MVPFQFPAMASVVTDIAGVEVTPSRAVNLKAMSSLKSGKASVMSLLLRVTVAEPIISVPVFVSIEIHLPLSC